MLRGNDGRVLAAGKCGFVARPAMEREETPRIFVPVEIEGTWTEAVVDTGGVYLLCNSEVVELLPLDPREALGTAAVTVRGATYRGTLHRVRMCLQAAAGNGVEIEATAFVPSDPFPGPTFLGWHGCLERVFFAVDPSEDTFYFGLPSELD